MKKGKIKGVLGERAQHKKSDRGKGWVIEYSF